MQIPLKEKYRVAKPAGCGKSGSQNSKPKKKSIAAALAASAKQRGK